MTQRGDNPNELLVTTGSALEYHVNNIWDSDNVACRPIDELLSEIEEEFDCPLVFLVLRREATTHVHFVWKVTEPKPQVRLADLLIAYATRVARIEYFKQLDKEYANEQTDPQDLQTLHQDPQGQGRSEGQGDRDGAGTGRRRRRG